ncbi:MAG TPA: tetratricopeptide repeat protein [Caulobacteraceae bacterium]|jgi:tetratricopeptide (TPR) repeat protein|nr:tetratricopeptide repeat protein [Caulobacteraceae bacterium]
MSLLRHLIALVPLAALGACATPAAKAPEAPVAAIAPQTADDASPYGLFLAGRAAMNQGRSDSAAGYFGRAARADDDARFLADRAFTASLLAGDVKAAAALAPTADDSEPAVLRLGALVRGVEALAEGKNKQARDILSGPQVGYPHKAAAALLAPWAAAAAGDAAASVVHPSLPNEPIAQFFGNLGQARLFERARRYDESETGYKALIGGGDPGGLATLGLGAMLERRGRQADAVAAYDQALARNPQDSAVSAARARAAAKKPAPAMLTIRQSAAEALMAPAAALLMQKQQDVALAYLRLALRLDPSRDEAWVLVGDIMGSGGDPDSARAAYLRPKPGSDQFVGARGKLAWSYQSAGDKESALRIARETVSIMPASREAAVTLADILRADERYEESAKVLDALIAAKSEAPDWRLLYMRAVAYEESDHWAQAEADLQAALKLRPDEPELLNFLGYSWIDRGEHLDEAMAMAKKAVSLNPQSGAMIDTLGWGYYRIGDYKSAVEQLETAVVLEPSDPDVNNHLGDAYWRVGRKTEAQFQWRRVLTLDPPAKTRADAEAKLKSGLTTPPARVAGS